MADSTPTDDSVYGKFKLDFSRFYIGFAYKKFKFCLRDHLNIGILGNQSFEALDLINSLENEGHCSSTEVSLLWEIAVLTSVHKAKQCVCRYITAKGLHNPEDGLTNEEIAKGLKEYRKILYKGMVDIAPGELSIVKAFYNISDLGHNNLWDAVFYLDTKNCLNTRTKLKRFADLLNEVAKTKIVDGLKVLVPENEEQVDKLVKANQEPQFRPTLPVSLSELAAVVPPTHQDEGEDNGTEESMDISLQSTPESNQVQLCFDIEQAFSKLQTSTLSEDVRPVRINRSQVVDTLLSMYKDNPQLVYKRIKVEFEGEPGEDYGGLSKEMFSTFWTEVESVFFRGQNIIVPYLSPTKRRTDAWKFETMGLIFSHSLVLTKSLPLKMPLSVLMQLLGNIDQLEEPWKESILLTDFLQYVSPNQKRILTKAINSFESLTGGEKTELEDFYSECEFDNIPIQGRIKEQILKIADIKLFINPEKAIAEMKKGIPSSHLDLFWSKLNIEHVRFFIALQKPTPQKVVGVIKTADTELTNKQDKALYYLKEFIKNMRNEELSDFLLLATGSIHQPHEILVSFTRLVGIERRPIFHTCNNLIELPTSYEHLQDFSNEMKAILKDPDSYKYTAI